jgi:hypothetical protein
MSHKTVNNDSNQTASLAKTTEFGFNILNDWSQWGGFTGSLCYTNKANSFEGWTIEFDAPFDIYEIWGGEIVSRKHNRYVIKDVDWNKDVDRGETIDFGFNARVPDKKVTAPSKYVFNGKSLDSPIETPSDDSVSEPIDGNEPDTDNLPSTPPNPGAVSRPDYNKSTGFFTLDGKLYDANGYEFVPRGVNNVHGWFDDNGDGADRPYETLDNIASFGVNSVRIVWSTDKNNDPFLEKIIQRNIDLKMVPMVEIHDFTGSTDTKQFLNEGVKFWTDRTKIWNKYEKYLMINIANEFGDWHMSHHQREDFPKIYKEIITRMRNAGINNTLVIDPFYWAKDYTLVKEFGQEIYNHDPQKNVMFSIHMYCGVGESKEKIADAFDSITEQGLAMMVGEFADTTDSSSTPVCDIQDEFIMAEAEEHNMGYYAWAWNDWEPSLGKFALASWEADSREDLTPSGQKIILDDPNGIANTAESATIF